MRNAFELLDIEKSGVLTLSEFKRAMENFPDISNEKIEEIFKTVDQDQVSFLVLPFERCRSIVDDSQDALCM